MKRYLAARPLAGSLGLVATGVPRPAAAPGDATSRAATAALRAELHGQRKRLDRLRGAPRNAL